MVKGKGNTSARSFVVYLSDLDPPLNREELRCWIAAPGTAPAFYWSLAYVILTLKKNGDWIIKGRLI